MKRKLALFMILAMLISLVPMNVFAATDNYVDKTPTVKKDSTATVKVTVEAKTGTTLGTESFKLTLEKAEFVTTPALVGVNAALTNDVSASEKIFALGGTDTEKASVEFTYEATEVGDVKVIVDGMGGTVSSTTLVIGKCVDGGTFAKVADTVTIGEVEKTLKTITIEESASNTLENNDVIKLRLPKGFTWEIPTTVGFYGGFTAPVLGALDSRDLLITVKDAAALTAIGGIYVTGTIVADSDANYGDVNVSISGDNVTDQTLLVGTYSDYAILAELDASDVPTIYSGRFEENDSDFEVQQINISEDIAGSILQNRKIRIEFNEEVTIMAVDFEKDVFNGTAPTVTTTDKSYIEFTYKSPANSGAEEMNFTFAVKVDADYAGDITATVGGSALGNETELVAGKAVLPATIAIAAKDVKLGLQKQAMGDITITEPDGGVWTDGEEIVITFPEGIVVDTTPDVKVTKGDVEVDDPDADDNVITVKIDGESDEASVITLTGGTVKLERNLAEGDYDATLSGKALNDDNDDVMDVVAFRVITPAPGDTQAGETVVFTIGSNDYMIGAVKMTSDVAPYINENGRTMLPLRALANALGVTDSQIIWSDAEHSVVIFKGDATLKVVIGQMFFNKNGVLVPMDTKAVIMNSRTFLPLRAMGEALGATITWDEATRTVTVN